MDGYSIFVGSILLLFFLLLPGWALSLAVFPRKDEVNVVERLGLSLFFGVIPHVLVYFFNKNTGLEINAGLSYIIILGVTALSLIYWNKVSK